MKRYNDMLARRRKKRKALEIEFVTPKLFLKASNCCGSSSFTIPFQDNSLRALNHEGRQNHLANRKRKFIAVLFQQRQQHDIEGGKN